MFENVGSSIKGIAKIVFWFGAIASVLIGISLMTLSGQSVIFMMLGWVVVIMGILISWLSVLLLFAYGELVERVCRIEEKIGAGEKMKKRNNIENINSNKGDSKPEKKVQSKQKTNHVFEELEYIDFVCPKCGETLSVEKSEKTIDCPYCGTKVNINE